RPFMYAGDALAARLPAYRVPRPPGTLGSLDPSTIAVQAERVLSEFPLRPAYEAVSLGWLLAEAAEKKEFGKLGGGIVRTREGDIAGWFAQYVSPRRV